MATLISTGESESEDGRDRDKEEDSNSEKNGESEVKSGTKEEQMEDHEVENVGGSDLVVKFGWCSLLFLVLFLIWTIIYFQDRLWQLEKIHAGSSGACTSIWHYGRGIILVTSTGIVWLCVVAWYMMPVEKTDFEKRTKQRIQEEKKDKEKAAKALFREMNPKSVPQAAPNLASVTTTPLELDLHPIPDSPPKPDSTPKPDPLLKPDVHLPILLPAPLPPAPLPSSPISPPDSSSDSEECPSSSDDEEINTQPMKILDLGSRLQKYWTMGDDKSTILSSAKKSTLCKLTDAGFQEVSEFLSRLDHPHVQKIHSVKCVKSENDDLVVIAQRFWKHGSLRDLIHGVTNPMADWDEKYQSDSGRPLPPNQIRVFGKQILEAMRYLYKLKFQGNLLRPLGQVQTGNIFIVDDGHCVLGGYENTVLSYRTSVYASLAYHGFLEVSDVIMFGHVIYEMCTGRSLNVVLPVEENYDLISDDTCRDVLRYIFKTKRGLPRHSIKKIKNLEFFFGSGSKYNRAKQFGIEMGRRARAYSTQATDKMTQVFNIQRRRGAFRRDRARSLSPSRSQVQSDDPEFSLFYKKCSIKAKKDRSRRNNRASSVNTRSDSESLREELTGFLRLGNPIKSIKRRRKKKKQQNTLTNGKSSETSGAEHDATEVTEVSNIPSPSLLPSTQPSPVMTTPIPSPEIPNTPEDSISSEVTDEEHTNIKDTKLEINKENQLHSKRCCIIFAVSSILTICLLILVLLAIMMQTNMECLAEVPERSWWNTTNPFRDYWTR